jgi:hypothetical protein
MRIPQGEAAQHLTVYSFHHGRLFHRLREQRHSVSDAPGQGVCRTQGPSYFGGPVRKVRVLTEARGAFEQGERPGQVALAEGQQTDLQRGSHQARGVSNRLGNLQPLFPKGKALGERPQLGMAPGEPGMGAHGGEEDLTKALVVPCPVEGHHGLPVVGYRPTILQEGQEGRQSRPKGGIQGEQPPGKLLAYAPPVIVILKLKIGLEQVDDRQIRRGLAIGGRVALQEEPALRARRMGELVEEAGLPHPRFPNDRYHLAVSGSVLFQDLVQGCELRLPPRKGGQHPPAQTPPPDQTAPSRALGPRG